MAGVKEVDCPMGRSMQTRTASKQLGQCTNVQGLILNLFRVVQ